MGLVYIIMEKYFEQFGTLLVLVERGQRKYWHYMVVSMKEISTVITIKKKQCFNNHWWKDSNISTHDLGDSRLFWISEWVTLFTLACLSHDSRCNRRSYRGSIPTHSIRIVPGVLLHTCSCWEALHANSFQVPHLHATLLRRPGTCQGQFVSSVSIFFRGSRVPRKTEHTVS